MEPQLSICIPNFNMGRWIPNAMRSALMQPTCEVIVVDNASTDNSAASIKQFHDKRLATYFADEHLPMYDNINRAVSLSTGEWCVILCADDELTASFYGQFAECCRQHPDAVAISQSAIDPKVPAIIGDSSLVVYDDPIALFRSPTLPLSTTVFSRSAFERTGGFCPKVGWAADWDLWMRLIIDGGAAVAAGLPGGLYHRSRGAWATAAGSRREVEWIKMWVEYRRGDWPSDVIKAMDQSLGERSERIGKLLLSQRSLAGLELLATAAAMGRKNAAFRLWLQKYPHIAKCYDLIVKTATGVAPRLRCRLTAMDGIRAWRRG